MKNSTSSFLKIYSELEKVSKENNTTTREVLQHFFVFYEGFLSLELEKEYEQRTEEYGVKQICQKYKISPKKFYKLLKGTGVKVQKRRDLKSIIINATKELHLTKEERIILSRYFEKREITTEKVIEKLNKIRT